MLPTQLFTSIQQLALSQRPLVTGVTDVAPVSANFEIGQKMQGHVQAQVAAGIFRVRVADHSLQMSLPSNMRTGDQVELEVVSLQPKLTFTMSASTNPLSTPDQLSLAARLFSALSQQPPERAMVRAAQGQALWLQAQPPDVPQLAGKLLDALSQSGLFYESHQVQWLEGNRSTAQLLQEPQNLTPEQAKLSNSAESARQILAQTDPNISRHLSSTPNHVQNLVQQQLNALDTGQVMWQGQVWQGQEMQWEIHGEAPRQANDESEHQWVTQIHLELPNLGEVSAQLRLTDRGLSLQLASPEGQTRTTLGSASSELVAALTERGISVISTQVSEHGTAE